MKLGKVREGTIKLRETEFRQRAQFLRSKERLKVIDVLFELSVVCSGEVCCSFFMVGTGRH